jgi:protein gp37
VVRLDVKAINEPLKWKKPQTVFVNSMSDLFHPSVPDSFLDEVFVVMREAKQHTFQVLTKRPDRMDSYVNSRWRSFDLYDADNIWYGTSVENQTAADTRISYLLRIRSCNRFLSVEPLLDAVDLRKWELVDWVIVGGESGHHARPMHPDWVRSVRDHAVSTGALFFFKQWGEWAPCTHFAITEGTESNRVHRFEDGQLMYRYGKKVAGRELDGREWDEMPV